MIPPRPGERLAAARPPGSVRSGDRAADVARRRRASGRPRRTCPGETRRPSRVPSHVVVPTPSGSWPSRSSVSIGRFSTRRGRGRSVRQISTDGARPRREEADRRRARRRASAAAPAPAACRSAGRSTARAASGGVVSSTMLRGTTIDAALAAQGDPRAVGAVGRARARVVAPVPHRAHLLARLDLAAGDELAHDVAVAVDDRDVDVVGALEQERDPRRGRCARRGWASRPGRRRRAARRAAGCLSALGDEERAERRERRGPRRRLAARRVTGG